VTVINRIFYATGDFRRKDVHEHFTSIAMHEVPRLAVGSLIWINVDSSSKAYCYEQVRVTRVIDTDRELAVACIGLASGAAYRRQVSAFGPADFYRLIDEQALAELARAEPRLVDPQLVVAA